MGKGKVLNKKTVQMSDEKLIHHEGHEERH
jgi:hypothetical protein